MIGIFINKDVVVVNGEVGVGVFVDEDVVVVVGDGVFGVGV